MNEELEQKFEVQNEKEFTTPEYVSISGVLLPRAENSSSEFVPDKNKYADYIEDDFSLLLQKQIATSWSLGNPVLIEGGTSIGKTTTVRKMAAELGWEVHYANLNGVTDVEDLMGRYIPNVNKKRDEDSDYVFADGPVTSGLRQEEGKIKVVILDEFNAARPDILMRLHEVLDTLEREENFVLLEKDAEGIPVSKSKTKIVALANPPGKGYFGRGPIDPALLRRLVYIKAPNELPKESFSYFVDSLFGLVEGKESDEVEFFKNISGIEEVVDSYKEFHYKAKKSVENRKIASDQPQPFTFDDRVEPRRVRDFVLKFYNGDINQTVQNALRYYYSNKLELEKDREYLEGMIMHVGYFPLKQLLERRGLERELPPKEEVEVQDKGVEDIIRNEQEKWRDVFWTDIEVKPLPEGVTPEVIEKLKEFGMELRYIPELQLGSSVSEDGEESHLFPGFLVEGIGSEQKSVSTDEYLKLLEEKYPGWHRFESLDNRQKKDHTVSRNLKKEFWEDIVWGRVPFPKKGGYWLAVEVQPALKISFDEVNNYLEEKKEILQKIDYPYGDIRMLEALEWNLLANRDGWGVTRNSEWTATTREDGKVAVVGDLKKGGAGAVEWHDILDSESEGIGFRLVIVL
jgi:hypothetical protein